jgi:hypothetical protein
MRRRGPAPMPRGVMRNPMEREALKPGRQKRAAPNINCMGESCGKLEAAQIAQFFLRQGELLFRGGCAAARKTRLPWIGGKISANLPRGGKVE